MPEKVFHEARDLLAVFTTCLPMALLGQWLFHGREVMQGRRRLLSWHLLWSLPVAAFSAVLASGAAEFFDLGPRASQAAAGIAGWFGVGGMNALALTLMQRFGSGSHG